MNVSTAHTRSSRIPVATAPQRVLVVEDDPTVQRFFSRVLEQAGFLVTTADDGQAAARLLLEGDFCAVVSDIAVPSMTGVELLRCARVHDLDVPIVLVTGAADIKTAAEAVSHGAFQLLMKPVSAKLLVGEVKRAARLHDLAVTRRHAMRLLDADNAEADRVADLKESLDHAMASMWMAYQPIARTDGSLCGYEALMRSKEPRLPNPPAVLEAAEQLGRLTALGRTARARAVDHIAQAPADALLFINLHARDVLDDELVNPHGPLAAHAHRIVLEITERASLTDIHDLRTRITDLRNVGFRIAIDDLGAGYAGLTSFTLLEPEFVKIDMSLVRDIDQSTTKRRLVRMITAACREMGISVVAEGIETPAERAAVIEAGCDLLQGYLIARPGPAFPEMAS